jgi:YHS domain-containing protein
MIGRILAVVIVGIASLLGCDSAGKPRGDSSGGTPKGTVAPAAPALSASTPAGAIAEVPALTLVQDNDKVCMVTNQFMGAPQIPIDVDGQTYYGCCEMCKARLANEPGTRTAKDPVTGETVDKAKAVIGREVSGKVHYFASAENLARYRPIQ